MATENKRLNTNPITWGTADLTFVPGAGEIWYYKDSGNSIFHLIGDGTNNVEDLRAGDYITQVNALGLSAGRISSQELTSGTLSTSGWYTIAEMGAEDRNQALANFVVKGGDGVFSVNCAIRLTILARTHKNTTIEIISKAFFDASESSDITGFRLAKSDSVPTAGVKLQVKLISSTALSVQINNNIGKTEGWKLVQPYLDNTPTIPDGVAAATFIEAGAELSFDTPTANCVTSWISEFTTDDILRCEITWPEIPKQGTGLEITLPSSNISFRNYGDVSSILGTFTTSNFSIVGKRVLFQINQTAIGLGKTQQVPVFPRIQGTGCKLTITG